MILGLKPRDGQHLPKASADADADALVRDLILRSRLRGDLVATLTT